MLNLVKKVQEAQTYKLPGIRELRGVRMPHLFEKTLEEVRGLTETVNPVEAVTPTNAGAEKAEWFAHGDPVGTKNAFHPAFDYDREKLAEIQAIEAKLAKVATGMSQRARTTDPLVDLLESLGRARVADLAETAGIAGAIMHNDVGRGMHLMRAKYGELDETLIAAAKEFTERQAKLAAHPDPERSRRLAAGRRISDEELQRLCEMEFNAEEMKFWFEWALKKYGLLKEFPVVVDKSAQYIDVRDKSAAGSRIVIPADRTVCGTELLQLVGHEIECHVRDSVNGQRLLRGLGGGVLKTDDERLYEGHAMVTDQRFYREYLGKDWAPQPWYILVSDLALQGKGFVEIAEILHAQIERVDPAAAAQDTWKHCYRVFRGSRNTFAREDPWIFLKDKGYFEGFLIARELEKNGLGHWLEIGVLRPTELLAVARTVKFEPEDVPIKYLDVVGKMTAELLSGAK